MSPTPLSLGGRRSAAQIEASRRNGAKSRGPISDAGKARAAQNARRHGLTSRTVVLATPEERAAHEALARSVTERYRPQDALEEHWVARMIAALWRQTRLEIVESRLLEALIAGEEPVGLPSLATLSRYRARIARDFAEARRELESLQEQRREARIRRAVAGATPERLRRLAEHLEDRSRDGHATVGGFAVSPVRGTNEPEPGGKAPGAGGSGPSTARAGERRSP